MCSFTSSFTPSRQWLWVMCDSVCSTPKSPPNTELCSLFIHPTPCQSQQHHAFPHAAPQSITLLPRLSFFSSQSCLHQGGKTQQVFLEGTLFQLRFRRRKDTWCDIAHSVVYYQAWVRWLLCNDIIPKAILLSQWLAQCPHLAKHANTIKLIELARTHRLWYTQDYPSRTRDGCMGWHWQLLMKHPMTLTSTSSNHQNPTFLLLPFSHYPTHHGTMPYRDSLRISLSGLCCWHAVSWHTNRSPSCLLWTTMKTAHGRELCGVVFCRLWSESVHRKKSSGMVDWRGGWRGWGERHNHAKAKRHSFSLKPLSPPSFSLLFSFPSPHLSWLSPTVPLSTLCKLINPHLSSTVHAHIHNKQNTHQHNAFTISSCSSNVQTHYCLIFLQNLISFWN